MLLTLPEVQADEVFNPRFLWFLWFLWIGFCGSVFKQHPLFSHSQRALQIIGYKLSAVRESENLSTFLKEKAVTGQRFLVVKVLIYVKSITRMLARIVIGTPL